MNRVLIVDDNVTLAYFTARNLQREIKGVEATTAASCRQARDLSEKHPPSLLIVDLRLPDGDGLELLGELSEKLPGVTAIVTSGNELPQPLPSGICASLTKPYEIDALVDLVRKTLPGSRVNNSESSERLNVYNSHTQPVTHDCHSIQNRLGALLAGLRAFGADLTAEADDADAVRRLVEVYVDRLCATTLEVAEIIKVNYVSSGAKDE